MLEDSMVDWVRPNDKSLPGRQAILFRLQGRNDANKTVQHPRKRIAGGAERPSVRIPSAGRFSPVRQEPEEVTAASISTVQARGSPVDRSAAERTSQPKATQQQRHMLHCNRPTKTAAAASAVQTAEVAKHQLANQLSLHHDLQPLNTSSDNIIPAIHAGANGISSPPNVDLAATPPGDMLESACDTGQPDSPHSTAVRGQRPAAPQQRPRSTMRVVVDVHASFDQNGSRPPIRFHGHKEFKESSATASHEGFKTSHVFASEEPASVAMSNIVGRQTETAQRPSDQQPLPFEMQSKQSGTRRAKHRWTDATSPQIACSSDSTGDETQSNDLSDSLVPVRQLDMHPSSSSRPSQAAKHRRRYPAEQQEVCCIT